ncbi:phosphopantetheinyl transferase [Dyadobacter jejuensis]|uniref:Phosphopantetheinyl transferase n=1 Tax=Dyadobacter jejuensis TaxID=1082580 RepID=A0A316AN16_9BACT|nr:4'-phosphopantetheinyl transferase superfamily protein [Dyadobacter jejuensis]PWJ58504.1 phosphopantetheinyl transferase [Dyadobacter jejuensis]
MAVTFIKKLGNTSLLGCWEIEESLSQLKEGLSQDALAGYMDSNKWSEKRQLEWLSVRQLLSQMTAMPETILYDQHGRPYLASDRYHISISHSAHKAVVLLGKTRPVGVDVQIMKTNTIRGSHYFINDQERTWLGPKDAISHHVIWSAKETIFKFYGQAELSILSQIEICPFQPEQFGLLSAYIHDSIHKTKLHIHYEVMGEYVLTYILS